MLKNILLVCLFLSTITVQSQSQELKLGSDIWPPFTNIDAEKSFALDLVHEALKRIDIEAKNEIVTFDDVLSAIDKGDLDGSAALWLTPERDKKYKFSEPYLYNQLILVGRKGSVVNGIRLLDLSGKKVGIVEQYAYGEIDKEEYNITKVKSKSDQKNLELLLSNKIDYMLVDKLLIQYMLKYQINDVSKHLEISNYNLMVKSLHFALRKDIENGDKIISDFNRVIKEMVTDGSYNEILELNWIKSDIDGDGKFELVLQGDHAGLEKPTDTYNIYAEKTFTQPTNDSYRYIIDGQAYEGWENIPDKYKIKVSPGQANPNNIGLIFSF